MPQNNLQFNMPPAVQESSMAPAADQEPMAPAAQKSSMTPLMSPEQMKQNLDQMYQQAKSKERQVNSRKLMDANSLRALKMQLIQQFFEFMRNQGVDPNDLGSINQFMGRLASQDPDLYELFEMAFNNLIQEESDLKSTPQNQENQEELPQLNQENQPEMRFKNIQEQMLRY